MITNTPTYIIAEAGVNHNGSIDLVDINYDSEINIFDLLLLSDFLQDI